MPLTIAQMALMSRLLDEALPLDEAERRAWLEKQSPEYPDLAQHLREALLPQDSQDAYSKPSLTLSGLAFAQEAGAAPASGLQPGARVGPYELIRLLGAGGMAEVWLARRADGAFKREVRTAHGVVRCATSRDPSPPGIVPAGTRSRAIRARKAGHPP
jgi:hypothetical protein